MSKSKCPPQPHESIRRIIKYLEFEKAQGSLCIVGKERLIYWRANKLKFRNATEAFKTWNLEQLKAWLNNLEVNVPHVVPDKLQPLLTRLSSSYARDEIRNANNPAISAAVGQLVKVIRSEQAKSKQDGLTQLLQKAKAGKLRLIPTLGQIGED
jgi:hypothetical protein